MGGLHWTEMDAQREISPPPRKTGRLAHHDDGLVLQLGESMGLQPVGLVLGESGLEALHLPPQLAVHRPQRLRVDPQKRDTPQMKGLQWSVQHTVQRLVSIRATAHVKERVPRREEDRLQDEDSLSIGCLTFMRCASASFSCVSRMTAVSMVCSFLCASSYDFLAARVAATVKPREIPHTI